MNKNLHDGLAHLRAARNEIELASNEIPANRSEFGSLRAVVEMLDVLITRVDDELDFLTWRGNDENDS